MVRGMPNIFIAHSLPQNGRVSVPVNPSSLVYSHLRNVSGTPAPEGTQGITINKLNILDALIGRLNQVKANNVELPDNAALNIDALIESYRQQIEQIIAASEAMPYIAPPNAEAGAVLNLTA